jgi:alkaline phosphatase
VPVNVFNPNCWELGTVSAVGDICTITGKWTGIVTTTRITHATPSPAYAHAANRRWECDADIPDDAYEPGENCTDVAWQLIHGERNHEIRVKQF